MARRYGGTYSRNSTQPPIEARTPLNAVRGAYSGATVHPVGARSNCLFIPPVVLAFASMNDGAIGFGLGLTGAGALLLGAWLLRGGLIAEAAYTARKVARRPAIPRKIFAAGLVGLGVALAVFANAPGGIAPVIYGVAASVLHLGAFGIDPLRDKRAEGIDSVHQARVTRAIGEAQAHLAEMLAASKQLGDRAIVDRVAQFQATALALFRTVEDDPRDLAAARKYLSVYLVGARDATVKFAEVYARTHDVSARRDYEALLEDLEQNFSARTQKLLLNDRTDLSVEIDVLRDRLQREGVHLNRGGD